MSLSVKLSTSLGMNDVINEQPHTENQNNLNYS